MCPKGTGGSNPPPSVLLRACASQDWPSFARSRTSSEALAKEVGFSLYYVYLIEILSKEGQRYIGITRDLKQRLREHNAGESSHTSKSSSRSKAELSSDTLSLGRDTHLRVSASGQLASDGTHNIRRHYAGSKAGSPDHAKRLVVQSRHTSLGHNIVQQNQR